MTEKPADRYRSNDRSMDIVDVTYHMMIGQTPTRSLPRTMEESSTLRAFDVARALAFVCDLSMGQPTDHSLRTAWLARQLAIAEGLNPDECDMVCEASLLRWSGCTANASEFAELLGDDIAGREAMVAMRPGWADAMDAVGNIDDAIERLARIHCEVSVEVARMLGLDNATQTTLWNILETYDGRGKLHRLPGDRVPLPVFIISVAGDLEIFTRVYGFERALALIAKKGGASYPASLIHFVAVLSEQWLRALDRTTPEDMEAALLTADMRKATSPELIADVIDLKLPWMRGFSRAVAQISAACCENAGLDRVSQSRVYRAGLIHGIGSAAVPNAAYDDPSTRSASAWERFRLAPYWTLRAERQIHALEREAEIASFAHERLDGSGYFRGAAGKTIPMEARILGTAVAWVELRSARPWRKALSASEAVAQLMKEAKIGRFDPNIVEDVGSSTLADRQPRRRRSNTIRLSSRETEVLHRISRGASNKEVARDLDLSPSTVRTHVESVFRKLECSTRAAAALKASSMGLLPFGTD